MSEAGYNPIADYALIGDTRTAALVSRDGSIDWYCGARFDSPAVLCRLLDSGKGGFFRVRPSGPYSASRSYVEDTNILASTFQTGSGEARLLDFMPFPRDGGGASRILRLVEGVRGSVAFEVELRPTFDYARAPAVFEAGAGGLLARAGSEAILLRAPFRLRAEAGRARASITVNEGDRLWIALDYASGTESVEWPPAASRDCEVALAATIAAWREWLSACTYEGSYAQLVRRSALVLKLLTYSPSGALVAAPTTSLPEEVGGVRNWDYRFTWLRDASLTLGALMGIGFHSEALAFFDWFEKLCITCNGRLQIVYGIDGREELREEILPHLEGYAGSRPVRIGNAAFDQRQLDVFGQAIDAAHYCATHMRQPHPPLWNTLTFLADRICEVWAEPDQGIWEERKEAQQYFYSKLLCWVGLDRALQLADSSGLAGDIDRWRSCRDEIRETLLRDGYNPTVGAFTRVLGGTNLDASALAIPLVGFLPATDPRVVSTVERIVEQLSANGLVYRYRDDDGLPGGEATFLLCGFWLVENLALQGRDKDARQWFDGLAAYANDLGLLSEEADPQRGILLGNFPQAFTHLALINAALAISRGGPAPEAGPPAGRGPAAARAGAGGEAPLAGRTGVQP